MKNFSTFLFISFLGILPASGMESPILNRNVALVKIATQSIKSIDPDLASQGEHLVTLWEDFWKEFPEAKKQDLENEKRFYQLFDRDPLRRNELARHIINTLMTQSALLRAIHDQADEKAINAALSEHMQRASAFFHFEKEALTECATFGSLLSENDRSTYQALTDITTGFLSDVYTRPFLRNLRHLSAKKLDQSIKAVGHTLCVFYSSRNSNPTTLLRQTAFNARAELSKQPAEPAAKTS